LLRPAGVIALLPDAAMAVGGGNQEQRTADPAIAANHALRNSQDQPARDLDLDTAAF